MKRLTERHPVSLFYDSESWSSGLTGGGNPLDQQHMYVLDTIIITPAMVMRVLPRITL
jgi:hypothetical protein